MRLASPVNGLGRTADIMRAGHAQAFAGRKLTDAFAPPTRTLDLVEALREPATVHGQIVQGACRCVQQVVVPDDERIKAKLAGHTVEQAFKRVATIDRAMTAHCPAWREIGIDPIAIIFDGRYIVDALQQCARVEDRDDAVTGIGAATLNHLAFAGGDTAVPSHAQLQPDIGLWA